MFVSIDGFSMARYRSRGALVALFACVVVSALATGCAGQRSGGVADRSEPRAASGTVDSARTAAVAPAADASAEPAQLASSPDDRSGTDAAATAANDGDVVCRREELVGTHRRVRVCRPRSTIESQREESQEFIRERRTPIVLGPEAGAQ